jgi:hypothetical protein
VDACPAAGNPDPGPGKHTGDGDHQDARRPGPLAALLAAEVVSTTGSQMTLLALPWFVLVTTGSPARMGVVVAADLLPMVVLAIPGGGRSRAGWATGAA